MSACICILSHKDIDGTATPRHSTLGEQKRGGSADWKQSWRSYSCLSHRGGLLEWPIRVRVVDGTCGERGPPEAWGYSGSYTPYTYLGPGREEIPFLESSELFSAMARKGGLNEATLYYFLLGFPGMQCLQVCWSSLRRTQCGYMGAATQKTITIRDYPSRQ